MDYGGQYNRNEANFFDQRDKENFEFQSWLNHNRVESRSERVKDNQEFFKPSIRVHSDNFNYQRRETPYQSRKKMDREQFNDHGFPFKTVLKSDNDKSGEVEAWWHRQDFERLGQPMKYNNQEDYTRRKDAKVKKIEDVDAQKKDSAQEENEPRKSDYEKFSDFEKWLHHQNSQKDLSKESVKVIKFEEEVGTPMDQNDEKEDERKKDAKVKKLEDDDTQKKDSAKEENEPKKSDHEKFSEFEKWLHHQNSQKDLSKEGIKVIKFEEEVGTPMDQHDEKEEERKKDTKVKKLEDDDVQKKYLANEENDDENGEERKKDTKVKKMEDVDAQKKDSAQDENESDKSDYEKFSKFENSQKDLSKEGVKVLKFEEDVGTPMDQKDEKEEERKKDAKVQKMEDDDGQKKREKIEADERDHDKKGQDQMFKNEAPDEEMKHQSKKDEEDNTETKSSDDGDSKYKYDNLFKKSRADIMPKLIAKEDIRKGQFSESIEPLTDKETDSKLLNSREATPKLKDMEPIHDEEVTLKENNRQEQIIEDMEPKKDEKATFKETSRIAETLEDIEPIKNEAASFKETNIKDQTLEDIQPVKDSTLWRRNFQTSSDEDIRRLANLDRSMMNKNQEYGNLDRRMSDNREYAYHPRRNNLPRYQDESYISRKSYERQQPSYDSRYIPVRQDYSGRYVPGPSYNSQYDQPRRVNYDYVPQRHNAQYEAM